MAIIDAFAPAHHTGQITMADDQTDRHEFASTAATAAVLSHGAELCRLQDTGGTDYLWPAAPAWPRYAPVLFPIIGRLPNDQLTHRGQTYRMTQHGFARDRRFTWVERTPTGCLLALADDAGTRAIYPFGFRFEVRYALDGPTLGTTFTIINTGDKLLPASMGAHPAFRWPLQPGLSKDAYALTFDADEPAPLRSVSGGLLTPDERPSPVQGRNLPLTESLFAADALILPAPASHSVRFAAPQGPALTVSWEGFPQLGIWSRPGAGFLCIEPWCGMSTPASFTGDFAEKPWLLLIPPGECRTAIHRVTLEP